MISSIFCWIDWSPPPLLAGYESCIQGALKDVFVFPVNMWIVCVKPVHFYCRNTKACKGKVKKSLKSWWWFLVVKLQWFTTLHDRTWTWQLATNHLNPIKRVDRLCKKSTFVYTDDLMKLPVMPKSIRACLPVQNEICKVTGMAKCPYAALQVWILLNLWFIAALEPLEMEPSQFLTSLIGSL